MQKLALTLCLALVAAGCQKDTQETATRVAEHHAQPMVAIVPVFDRTDGAVSWNLSNELTTLLRHRLTQKSKLYLANDKKVRAAAKKMVDKHDPFAVDISWMRSLFQGNQFVVFLELIEHAEAPTKTVSAAHGASTDLNMSMKIRIVDLRGERPKIVLQEIVHEADYIPKQLTKANFAQVAWGEENFHASPVGLAHMKLVKELAKRIDDYVTLATE